MKPSSFEYVAPRTLDEAIHSLTSYAGAAKVLAGGQSLVPLMNQRKGTVVRNRLQTDSRTTNGFSRSEHVGWQIWWRRVATRSGPITCGWMANMYARWL